MKRRPFPILCALCVLWILPPSGGWAETRDAEVSLASGTALERPLAGGEEHDFPVFLAVGHALRVVVTQQGVDAVVDLSDPAGNRLRLAEIVGRAAAR